jgi:type I restriction enzyme, S subunit
MKVKSGFKQTDIGPIPKEWEVRTLREIAAIKTGPFGTLLKASEYSEDDGVPLISVGEIRDGYLQITRHTPRVPEGVTRRLSQYVLRQGDIVFGRKGGVERSALIRQNQEGWFLGSDGMSVRPQGCHSEYLAFQLRNARVRGWLLQNAVGTTMPSLNQEILNNVLVPLPPTKTEQQAIAEALSDADVLIDSLGQLLVKKRRIKQGAMQELLTGKKRLPGFSGRRELKRLGDVVDTDPENLGSDTRPNFTFNYIALEDVDQGKLNSYSEEVFRFAPSRARRKLRKDDILVSTVRPNLMSHLLFSGSGDNWVCSTGFCVVRCRKDLSHPGYVYFHMFAGCVARQIESLLTGSNYPSINSGDVRALEILFPEYKEQAAIASILSDMDAEITALEAKLVKTRQIKQAMMQELLSGRIRLV